jgi:cell division protein FtsX
LKLRTDELRATNPLRDELRVELHYPADFWKVRAYLTSIPGVTGTRNPGVGAHIPAQMQVARTLLLALLALFAFVGSVLIWATRRVIRRTVRARQSEMRVMILVGASPAFIHTPFLLQGAALGALGAILASTILAAMSRSGILGFAPFSLGELLKCAAALLGIGAILGVLGAALALRGVGYERFEKTGARRKDGAKVAPVPVEIETPSA